MDKTIVLGDTHGRSFWKLILNTEKDYNRVIFVGDYFDTHDKISAAEQIHNFKEIIQWKLDHPEIEVILLIGNHDLSYMPGIQGFNVSGYQAGAAPNIQQVLEENKEHLQVCYLMGEFLFSHAGISPVWLNEQGWDGKESLPTFVNELFKYRPLAFEFNGIEPHGDNIYQTPVWIRPRSLMSVCKDNFNKIFIQVLGHTQVNKIDIEGKATGGRYYFIDAIGTSREYLIIEDNKVSVGKF